MPAISLSEVSALFAEPLLDLVHRASLVHREHHDSGKVQCSHLLSIKTGGCPEDCGYCSQSAHHDSGVAPEKLMGVEEVRREATRAKADGADRFCMGAAWRGPRDGEEFERVLDMVREVKALGLETCATLGKLEPHQAVALREAGLDYYNHNLDTGRSHYDQIVTTHDYDDRLATLGRAREAGLKLCCGGILGLGEAREARAELIHELANLEPQPESVPVNALVPIEGTPKGNEEAIDWSEVVRTVAAARIALAQTTLRLSAGRAELGEAAQALCFLAGANSIFLGDRLLTTPNPEPGTDRALFDKLGLRPVEAE